MALTAEHLTLGYRKGPPAVKNLTLQIPSGQWTAIIGPNGSGKSTLLRAFSGQLRPTSGAAQLDGVDLASFRSRELARKLMLLPQHPSAPPGFTVIELVGQGRFAHLRSLQTMQRSDHQAIENALRLTHTSEYRNRPVNELSGGERQRAFLALAIAQESPILLLDEPTTFLDIGHQFEALDLLRTLQRERGLTIVTVLHDLTQAARYSDQLVMLDQGHLVARGKPHEVLTEVRLADVFHIRSRLINDQDGLLCIPLGSSSSSQL